MIDFDFRPETYFDGTGPSTLLAKLYYPESTWGDEISLYATSIDGEILYEAIDFYGNDFILHPEKSVRPFSLQELIVLIERLEVQPGDERGHIDQTLLGIPKAKSNIYVSLEAFFEGKRKHFGLP